MVGASPRPRTGLTTAIDIDGDIHNNFSISFGGQERLDPAKLYKNPITLYDLSQEYEIGISGTKPAKDFTRAEGGETRVCIAVKIFVGYSWHK